MDLKPESVRNIGSKQMLAILITSCLVSVRPSLGLATIIAARFRNRISSDAAVVPAQKEKKKKKKKDTLPAHLLAMPAHILVTFLLLLKSSSRTGLRPG